MTASAVLALTGAGQATGPADEQEFHLPAQDLGRALRAAGRASGLDVMFPADAVAGRTAPALDGHFAPREAFDRLLAGSGLAASFEDGAVLIRGRSPDADASTPSDATPDEAIVVTGSQIRGAAPVGSKVITIGRKAIDESGFTSPQAVVQSLPQNFAGGPNEGTTGLTIANGANLNTAFGSSVNLRGLGPSSTLVLLDGNRLALGGAGGVFGDLSMIPASAIDRIEILTDGASSLYGSDAVAGVVNIIPRKDFTGALTTLTHGSADDAANEVQFSQLLGAKWSGGHVMVAYEYDSRARFAADDTRFYTEDLRRFGGPDYRLAYGAPGTLIDANGQTYAIPGGQDGHHLTAAQLVPGTANVSDDLAGTDVLPKQSHHSVYAAASQDIGSSTSIYAEGLFTVRHYDRREQQSLETPLTVTSTNPFYVDPTGTGAPVDVQYRLSNDFGPERFAGAAKAWSAVLGATRRFGAWSLDVHGVYGQQIEDLRDENVPNYFRLLAALDDPDPASAFNPFGSGPGANSAQTVATIRGIEKVHTAYTVGGGAAKADGPLFDLPAGAVRAAIGGEVRFERDAERSYDDFFSDPATTTDDPVSRRRILAGFAELDVPIVAPGAGVPLIRKLSIAGSVRVENYDDFGTTTNPKIGLDWQPTAGVTIRSTFGTSFRAPSFNDLRQDALDQQYYTTPIPDPRSPTGSTDALVLVGNKPGIGPERARTITAGIDVAPIALPGLSLSATWFAIRYRDRIEDARSQTQNVLRDRAAYAGLINESPTAAEIAAYYASPSFENDRNIPASAIRAIIDVRNQNLAVSKESGLDFQASYAFAAGRGKATFGIDGTWLFHLKEAFTPTAPYVDVLGTSNNPTSLRFRTHAGWSSGPFSIVTFVNYISGYRNILPPEPEHVSSWTTVDATVSWDIAGARKSDPGVRLSLSALNLFDRDPPYVNNDQGYFGFGYDPQAASPLGRVVSVTAAVRW